MKGLVVKRASTNYCEIDQTESGFMSGAAFAKGKCRFFMLRKLAVWLCGILRLMDKTMLLAGTYEKSLELLHRLITPQGFTASVNNVTNYKRVWSRDGVVATLAALAAKDVELIMAGRQTLATLRKHQDHTGRIPSNVALDEKKVSYGTNVGRVDATIWYVLGVCQVALQTKDKAFFAEHAAAVERALGYLDCLELNGRGLLYVPHSGDWADEYVNHGYVLFDQILRYVALQSCYKVTKDKQVKKQVQQLGESIVVNYFPKRANMGHKAVYHRPLFERSLQHYKPPFPLAYFTTTTARDHVDMFATSLLLLSGLLDERAERAIYRAVEKQFLSHHPLVPAFHPVIMRGSEQWQHLRQNYLFTFKNKPHEYHNGGLWPLVHGFFLATMAKPSSPARASQYLTAFAMTLEKDKYCFPEFYNGKTLRAGGTTELGFSAAAYVLAHHAIIEGKAPLVR